MSHSGGARELQGCRWSSGALASFLLIISETVILMGKVQPLSIKSRD
jgi:hypothetical protein